MCFAFGNFTLWLVESADVKLTDMEGQLCSLYFAILQKGLEHLWILVPSAAPGNNLLAIPKNCCNQWHLT